MKKLGIFFVISLAFVVGIVWQKTNTLSNQAVTNNQVAGENTVVKTNPTAVSTTNKVATPKPSQKPTTATKEQETWRQVKSWSGSGILTTEQFDISGKQWRINYTLQASQFGSALLQVYVYDTQKDYPVEVPVNTTSIEGGTSYVYKTGTFYLKISGMDNWTVTVEELK